MVFHKDDSLISSQKEQNSQSGVLNRGSTSKTDNDLYVSIVNRGSEISQVFIIKYFYLKRDIVEKNIENEGG